MIKVSAVELAQKCLDRQGFLVVPFAKNPPSVGTKYCAGLHVVEFQKPIPGPFFVVAMATRADYMEQAKLDPRPLDPGWHERVADKAVAFVKMMPE
jgi:hypothetical protein